MADTWILLRGLVREQRHWESFPELLRKQNPGKSIITVDVAGNGERFAETSPASINGLMESVRSRLQETQLPPPYNLIAISMGAMIGLEWLTEHPEETHKAVLMNTSLRAFNPFYQRLQPQSYSVIAKGLFSRQVYNREKSILDITANLYNNRAELAEKWAGYYQQHPISKANAIRQLTAAARYKAPRHAPHQQVLVLNGAKDRLVSPECSLNLARNWQLPLRQHPQAGHDLTLDAGDWVAQQIQRFFAPQRKRL
ncbi:MAG: alpha/beta hydrolase [Gammaproteobacteria bacterium]|nr:MAG: alpha/beta hydrolase [Gammaproteobacteria bacterium]